MERRTDVTGYLILWLVCRELVVFMDIVLAETGVFMFIPDICIFRASMKTFANANVIWWPSEEVELPLMATR